MTHLPRNAGVVEWAELVEEALEVDDGAGAKKVLGVRVNQPAWQQVERKSVV